MSNATPRGSRTVVTVDTSRGTRSRLSRDDARPAAPRAPLRGYRVRPRFGRLPLAVVGQLATAFAPGDGLPLQRTLLGGIVSQLLAGFSVGRRRYLRASWRTSRAINRSSWAHARGDAGLRGDRPGPPGVRYGSVVTRAARGHALGARDRLDPGAQGCAVYRALYRIVAQPSRIEPARLTRARRRFSTRLRRHPRLRTTASCRPGARSSAR